MGAYALELCEQISTYLAHAIKTNWGWHKPIVVYLKPLHMMTGKHMYVPCQLELARAQNEALQPFIHSIRTTKQAYDQPKGQ